MSFILKNGEHLIQDKINLSEIQDEVWIASLMH